MCVEFEGHLHLQKHGEEFRQNCRYIPQGFLNPAKAFLFSFFSMCVYVSFVFSFKKAGQEFINAPAKKKKKGMLIVSKNCYHFFFSFNKNLRFLV